MLPFETATQLFRQLVERVMGLYERSGQGAPPRKPPAETLAALDQFMSIAHGLNCGHSTAAAVTDEDITRLGDYGITLLTELDRWAAETSQTGVRCDIRCILLAVADWIVRHKGSVQTLEPVVDACAYAANNIKDHAELGELSCLMGAVATACSNEIKSDLDNANPGRPWRLLHWNRAIAAARSHRLELMEKAFEQLLKALPQDAGAFFREGMSEMERLDYPEEVRVVMQRYFDRYTRPTMN